MMMRIDSHAHGDPDFLQGDPQAYVATCRARGIEAVLLIAPLDRCLAAQKKFGDFVIPVALIEMNTATPADVAAQIQAGARGIKFFKPLAPYADERFWPLYAKLEALGAVAVFHTGYLMRFPGPENPPIHMDYMRAAQIEAISRRFPQLKILMGHFSNPWWEEAWKVSLSAPNVYADLSGGTAILRSLRLWAEMFAPDGQVIEASMRKLCFGSDVSYFKAGAFPFQRYLEFYDKLFDRIGLAPELRERVNRGNLRQLFGLAAHA